MQSYAEWTLGNMNTLLGKFQLCCYCYLCQGGEDFLYKHIKNKTCSLALVLLHFSIIKPC